MGNIAITIKHPYQAKQRASIKFDTARHHSTEQTPAIGEGGTWGTVGQSWSSKHPQLWMWPSLNCSRGTASWQVQYRKDHIQSCQILEKLFLPHSAPPPPTQTRTHTQDEESRVRRMTVRGYINCSIRTHTYTHIPPETQGLYEKWLYKLQAYN